MYVCVHVFMPMETVLYAYIFTIIYQYIHVCSYSCSQGLLVADSSISSDRLYLHSQASPPAPPTHPASPPFRLPLKMGATVQRHLFFTYGRVKNARWSRSHQQPAVASIRQHQMAPQILYQRWLFFVGSVVLISFLFVFRRCLWA